MEKTAAYQLKEYLEAATGEAFSVAHESVAPQCKKIHLGKTNAFLSLGVELDEEELNGDGFVLIAVGDALYIAGATDTGTLYGVYYYLEEYVGVRFYGLDEEYVPSVSELEFPETQVTEVPAFKYRGALSDATMHAKPEEGRTTETVAEYYAKIRQSHEFLQSEVQPIADQSCGGTVNINKDINQSHNNLTYVPAATYYESYPSMFYTRAGGSSPVDICYSSGINADGSIQSGVNAASAYVEGLKKYILLNPCAEYHMLGQQDITDYCQCSACVSGTQAYGYGAYAGVTLRFYNAVAKAIAAWETAENRTHVKLVCYSYLFTTDAPVTKIGGVYTCHNTVKLASNLTIRFADFYANQYFSFLAENQVNGYGEDYLEKWSCVLGENDSWYWGYATNHSYYFAYTPSLQKIQQTLAGLQELGTEYVLFQHSTSEYNDWRAKMETYVISKLLWDPTEDVAALRNEYLDGYYGAASEKVTAFINNFDACMAQIASGSNYKYFCYDIMAEYNGQYKVEQLVTKAFLESQLALLDEAEADVNASALSAEEKATLIQRIDAVRLTPMFYLAYSAERYYTSETDIEEARAQFISLCESVGVAAYGEHKYISSLKAEWGV